ncbi:MAG: ComF family protein [Bacteroidales bacterium]
MRSYLEGLLALIFPEACLVCGNKLVSQEKYLCTTCLTDIPRTRFHNDPENIIQQIFWGRVPLKYATSFFYFTKGSRYQKLMHSFKYSQKKEIGLVLGQLLGAELRQYWEDLPDCIVPVPLHPKKMRKRGYNQSEWIALGLSRTLKVPVETGILIRTVANPTQTRKGRFDRWKNVASIFAIQQQRPNSHILLVDDVITTGATLEACAQTLLSMEHTTVSVASLAYASN